MKPYDAKQKQKCLICNFETSQNKQGKCDGDYWYANPKFFLKPYDWQVDRKRIDQEKMIAQRNGYHILRFWEDDIINSFDKVKSIMHDLLATT